MATYTKHKQSGSIYEVFGTNDGFTKISNLITGQTTMIPALPNDGFQETDEKEANEYIRLKKGKKS